jgi:16S rRNA (uracil1498-N3)-methyltransferase
MNNLFLSNANLYYSRSVNTETGVIGIEDEERNHILNVMRHKISDEIYVTDGRGKIFQCIITNADKSLIGCKILKQSNYEQRFPNITFCIPMLRNSDRLEFALEKCTEIGITNFILYQARRSIGKRFNQKRIEKILISAMKQALLSWLPKVTYIESVEYINSLTAKKIIFDQNSKDFFDRDKIKSINNYLLIFGPEGGFTKNEMDSLSNSEEYYLVKNRLRTETAIIKVASLL